jgi:hypothetical protein
MLDWILFRNSVLRKSKARGREEEERVCVRKRREGEKREEEKREEEKRGREE